MITNIIGVYIYFYLLLFFLDYVFLCAKVCAKLFDMKTKQTIPQDKVILETRTPLKDLSDSGESLFPVKLRVTYMRKRRYYKIDILPQTKVDWAKIESQTRLPKRLQEDANKIKRINADASETISETVPFSFDNFRAKFFVDRKIGRASVYEAMQAYVNQLKKEGRESTAVSYQCALNSLKEFKTRLLWEDLTPRFLEAYEMQMLEGGRSVNTIGIYLRSLRTIANIAVSKSIITREMYPFGKHNHGKYQIPASQNVKKALTKEEITKIKDFNPRPGSRMEKARDFWLFSYYINGLNVKDIAYLQWKNVDPEDGMIRFIRKKTERANKSKQIQISAVLTPFAESVVKKYSIEGNQDDFIFPILKPNMNSTEVYNKIQGFTKMMNKGMKDLAKELEINKPITTYSARHSHATILLQNGASMEMIMDQFKHSSMKVTMNYVDSLTDNSKKDLIKNL